MGKPKPDLDERFSLHPLTGEEALRRLLGADKPDESDHVVAHFDPPVYLLVIYVEVGGWSILRRVLLDGTYQREDTAPHGRGSVVGLPVRAMRARMAATRAQQAAQGLPEVQEPLLGHPTQDRAGHRQQRRQEGQVLDWVLKCSRRVSNPHRPIQNRVSSPIGLREREWSLGGLQPPETPRGEGGLEGLLVGVVAQGGLWRGVVGAIRVDDLVLPIPALLHGITEERFWEIVQDQGRACPICDARFTPAARHPMAIDHNHETGEVRGVLCAKCNYGLGMFQDSPDVLRAALRYLEERGHYGPSTT